MILLLDSDHRGKYKTMVIDGKEVYEHRYVVEQFIGRKLTKKEQVHHKDRNPSNNSLVNLILCKDDKEHKQLHAKEDCEAAGYDYSVYRWCSYHQKYELRETFGKHKARCKVGTNEFRKHKNYKSIFDWKNKLNQQYRRAMKKGIISPLKEGRCP